MGPAESTGTGCLKHTQTNRQSEDASGHTETTSVTETETTSRRLHLYIRRSTQCTPSTTSGAADLPRTTKQTGQFTRHCISKHKVNIFQHFPSMHRELVRPSHRRRFQLSDYDLAYTNSTECERGKQSERLSAGSRRVTAGHGGVNALTEAAERRGWSAAVSSPRSAPGCASSAPR